ncbi:MAG TPA: acyltransferase family protein [Phycisphaerae bacterium]|nr:acyltransferase family protein [Phycisphaerae bacterium]HRY69634.1 acyltransferase family protein [Phycisphaerae bacterium]HSA27251.1 acyltransferase family protein [Phycisphaerae bacterium]
MTTQETDITALSHAPVLLTRPRVIYLDNLKLLLTILVIAHHAALAYGPFRGIWHVENAERADVLGSLIVVNSMFFMGLFFFIAGYFTMPAYDRKGARRFVLDRALRLGIPSLAWLAASILVLRQVGYAHMWFAVDLLALSILYAVSRLWQARTGRPRHDQSAATPPSRLTIVIFIIVLGLATAAVRRYYPIGHWIAFLGFLPLEVNHWVQYLSLFLLGIVACRNHWLEGPGLVRNTPWLPITLALVLFFLGGSLWPAKTQALFDVGGGSGGMVLYSLLEAILCVSLSITLLWAFRRWLNTETPFSRVLAANSYGIYFIHYAPVLILQYVLLDIPLHPIAKFLLVTAGSFVLSLAASVLLLRSTRWGRRVF